MINSRLKRCCEECKDIEIETIVTPSYNRNMARKNTVKIICKHQCVCEKHKQWSELENA